MFETIGQTTDPQALGRSVWSTLATLAGGTLLVAATAVLGPQAGQEAAHLAPLALSMVEVVFEDPALTEADLPPPPPAPVHDETPEAADPGADAAAPPDAAEALDPNPSADPEDADPSDDPAPLDALPADGQAVADADRAPPTAEAKGGPGRQAGSGAKTTASAAVTPPSEGTLAVKSRVQPEYPPLARHIGLSDAQCIGTVEVDARGVPLSVEVDGCSQIYFGATRRALMKWRWHPLPEHLGPSARTRIAVNYSRR